jgi:multiple sugar transport system permease protein
MFDLPYILIGAQKGSVETLSMLAQNEASNVRFGPASAYAVILFVYVFLVALAFVRLLGADLVGDGGGGTRRRKWFTRRGPGEATA